MAISFISAGTGSGGLTTATPGMPAGATTDDFLILVIEGEGEDASADSPPTGGAWTSLGSIASVETGSAFHTRISAYWAWYDAGLNLTVPDAGDHTVARIYCFRGVDTTTPLDGVSPLAGTRGNSALTSHSIAPGISSTTNAAWAVLCYTHGDDALTPASHANASLTGLGVGGSYDNSAGSDGTVDLIYGEKTTAGGIGTFTWTTAAVEHVSWVALFLKPAPAFTVYDESLGISSSSTLSLGGVLSLVAGTATVPQSALTVDPVLSLFSGFSSAPQSALTVDPVLSLVAANTFTSASSNDFSAGVSLVGDQSITPVSLFSVTPGVSLSESLAFSSASVFSSGGVVSFGCETSSQSESFCSFAASTANTSFSESLHCMSTSLTTFSEVLVSIAGIIIGPCDCGPCVPPGHVVVEGSDARPIAESYVSAEVATGVSFMSCPAGVAYAPPAAALGLGIPCVEGDPIQAGPTGGGGVPTIPGGPSKPVDRPPPNNFPNEEVSYTVECPPGYTGDPVTVTIPAGTYRSPIPGRATAIALRLAAQQARSLLVCTVGGGILYRFCCSSNFNSVATAVDISETHLLGMLEEEAFANQLDCSEVVCLDAEGDPIEASVPFELECVGGTWYSDPAPEFSDRWEVISPLSPGECTNG